MWRVLGRRFQLDRFSWSLVDLGEALLAALGRTDVPKIVDWYMEGKIHIDKTITHTMPLTESTQPLTSCTKASIRSVVTY